MARAISHPVSHPARRQRVDTGPVALSGTLIVKWIAGRNGDFSVGDLHTSIGEFKVKDALLDQFEEGEYRGTFWISQIYSKPYEYRGRITIETRASIADLQIDHESDAPDDLQRGTELDPIDEAPPAPPPQRSQPTAPAAPAGKPRSDADADEVLFGIELFECLQDRRTVKLDPTVDRLRFRQQKERLKALQYAFDVKSQSWSLNA